MKKEFATAQASGNARNVAVTVEGFMGKGQSNNNVHGANVGVGATTDPTAGGSIDAGPSYTWTTNEQSASRIAKEDLLILKAVASPNLLSKASAALTAAQMIADDRNSPKDDSTQKNAK